MFHCNKLTKPILLFVYYFKWQWKNVIHYIILQQSDTFVFKTLNISKKWVREAIQKREYLSKNIGFIYLNPLPPLLNMDIHMNNFFWVSRNQICILNHNFLGNLSPPLVLQTLSLGRLVKCNYYQNGQGDCLMWVSQGTVLGWVKPRIWNFF